MKTIKQIADELGVSKTAVRKKIENQGLQTSLHKSGNLFLIDESAETSIKSAFKAGTSETKTETSSQTENQELSVGLQLMIDTLKAELEAKNDQLKAKDEQLSTKDKQLEALNDRLAEAQHLLNQQQQLNAVAEQKILALESKEQQEPKRKFWQFWK